ncbi:MAG TPA: hypothetical protein VM532_00105 [Burkholderiales bacterium]|nr:hypothetical protein [Burkholderiales bacterium]
MKLFAFALLLANLVLVGFIYASETRVASTIASTDLNADKMKLAPLKPVAVSKKRKAEPLVCMEWRHIAGAELERARGLLAEFASIDKVTETKLEEPTRFWVRIPASDNSTGTFARLKAAGIKELSLEPDNGISLGVFSNEEAARRRLAELKGKGFAATRMEPRAPHVKEANFVVRDVSKAIADQLDQAANKIEGSSVQSIECPVVEEKKARVEKPEKSTMVAPDLKEVKTLGAPPAEPLEAPVLAASSGDRKFADE